MASSDTSTNKKGAASGKMANKTAKKTQQTANAKADTSNKPDENRNNDHSGSNQKQVTLADLTTLHVGGPIKHYVAATTRDKLIGTILDADDAGTPVLVIGGGSNLVGSDAGFNGTVVRDLRKTITILTENADDKTRPVRVKAEAGVRWDAFVRLMISQGYEGVEALSGIPGTVGASVVQNIGAYGQEVSASVNSVEVWDRKNSRVISLTPSDMHFGYRTSALKQGMYTAEGKPDGRWFPTPRFIVLSVTFALAKKPTVKVDFSQLAQALGISTGTTMDITRIRSTVISIRGAKGMLEDPKRYRNPWLASLGQDPQITGQPEGTRKHTGPVVRKTAAAPTELSPELEHDRWSCGSFFINPVISQKDADKLPADAPRFPVSVTVGQGREQGSAVKTSAAWLIDHAGFHKGFKTSANAHVSLSTLHTLALTNRGGATAQEIMDLAQVIQKGVKKTFGIDLVPEPVILQGVALPDSTVSGAALSKAALSRTKLSKATFSRAKLSGVAK